MKDFIYISAPEGNFPYLYKKTPVNSRPCFSLKWLTENQTSRTWEPHVVEVLGYHPVWLIFPQAYLANLAFPALVGTCALPDCLLGKVSTCLAWILCYSNTSKSSGSPQLPKCEAHPWFHQAEEQSPCFSSQTFIYKPIIKCARVAILCTDQSILNPNVKIKFSLQDLSCKKKKKNT